jgi:UTP-glucose-1-phosphate uridylyltransferase
MQPTLVILAAGMASRYGSMKQTEGFGPNGETIMDYSIYDAIRAGFKKVVFIIRQDFAQNFKANFEPKLAGKIITEYVYQERDTFVQSAAIAQAREKPWGTGHAMLCAKNAVHEPFAIINADDFYGQHSFVAAAQFLQNSCNQNNAALLGYELAKTLSSFGTVSRGVTQVNPQGQLTNITERTKIYKEDNQIVYEENDEKTIVPADAKVSMNFWAFHPSIFTRAEQLFAQFEIDNAHNPKAEFFIPTVAQHFMQQNGNAISVIPTHAQWFGVTYKEDAPTVKASLDALLANNEYPQNLWA